MNKRHLAPVLALASLGLLLPLSTGCAKHIQLVAVAPVAQPVAPVVAVAAPEPPREIALPGELEFDVNKATMKDTPESNAVLAKVLEVMQDNPRITKLRIEGHTDGSGRARKNQRLSQARADAVAQWLTDHGVDGSRVATVGFGSSRPIVDNDTPEHRMMNRRTEFHVQEIDGEPTEDSADAPLAQPAPQ